MSDAGPPTPDDPRRAARLAELGLMSASLIHELRQPLFALKAQAQLLARTTPEASVVLLDEIAHMEALVRFYGSFGQDMGPVGPVDLNAQLRDLHPVFVRQGRTVRVELVLELHPRPVWVQARRGAVRQVLVNLIRNAIEAISGAHERGTVRARTQAGGIVVIEDDGPGIDSRLHDALFDAWTTTKGEQGSGLGLYLTRTLCEEAGGTVTVEAVTPRGSRFTVTLPEVVVEGSLSSG